MRLYLMQHGNPVSVEENPDRPLSQKGRQDVERMADFLKKAGMEVDRILHSGKTRARQTAEIMAARLWPATEPLATGGLSPADDAKVVKDHILQDSDQDLLIVGHLPHLARLTSLLVTGNESISVALFQQGGLLCLESGEKGDWAVAWMLIPALIP